MRNLFLLIVAVLLFMPAPSAAQTRSRTTTKKPSPSSSSSSGTSSAARNAGAAKVAERIKDLTRFLYLLGGVAKGIEQVDAAAAKKEASPAALQQNDQNKATVKNSLRNVREGLDQLEIEFRTTPDLTNYYVKLVGSASGAAAAEDLAGRGQFEQAGRTLLGVVNRLTDVLLAMR